MNHKKSDYFYFKEFKLLNPSGVFKINTDGVLLGTWCTLHESENADDIKVLDVGTGTGVIAFALSQRYPYASVVAIDTNHKAIDALQHSLDVNPRFSRITARCTSFFDLDIDALCIDHLVSNPPFFKSSTLPSSDTNARAKHDFSFIEFWKKISETLNKPDYISMILPTDRALDFIELANNSGYDRYRERLVTKEDGTAIRLLFTLKRGSDTECNKEPNLIIQTGGNRSYTDDYKNLTKNFYLNF